jgi:hypothetical protein
MSRTRRRKHYGDPGTVRDGQPPAEGKMPSEDFAREVRRRDRRTREDEADRIARGEADADDVPTKPRPKRLWEFWRRW